jgi:hypothetical protein
MDSKQVSTNSEKHFGKIIKIDDAQVKSQLGELVRGR